MFSRVTNTTDIKIYKEHAHIHNANVIKCSVCYYIVRQKYIFVISHLKFNITFEKLSNC